MNAMNISPEIISLIDKIKNNKTHGASQLARQAARVLRTAAEHSRAETADQLLLELKGAGERLISARPAMAPLANIIIYLLKATREKSVAMDLASARRLVIAEADEAIKRSQQAVTRIARYGAEIMADGDRIMTHSYSSTVVAMLRETFNKKRDIKVIITRSSGRRTAKELGRYGVAVTIVNDDAIDLHIAGVDKVVVGADRLCADGKLVNGIGTYQLALAARKANIPFYVLCEMLKFDPRLRGEEVDLEEPSGVSHPGFDITPPQLITAVITENGLLTLKEVIRYLESQ
ncbi:MAG: hypothetical protein E3J67_03335 [Dehalococcoidia bacterium]|nr:MAG: hypothetical protein E3J67_03335 [Dehalococcoidia bacterium]